MRLSICFRQFFTYQKIKKPDASREDASEVFVFDVHWESFVEEVEYEGDGKADEQKEQEHCCKMKQLHKHCMCVYVCVAPSNQNRERIKSFQNCHLHERKIAATCSSLACQVRTKLTCDRKQEVKVTCIHTSNISVLNSCIIVVRS